MERKQLFFFFLMIRSTDQRWQIFLSTLIEKTNVFSLTIVISMTILSAFIARGNTDIFKSKFFSVPNQVETSSEIKWNCIFENYHALCNAIKNDKKISINLLILNTKLLFSVHVLNTCSELIK